VETDMPTAGDLFERHHQSVFRFLRRMQGSAQDAEDLTQEVFLRVLRALDGYEERQLERAWLFRIARNVLLDHRRARGRVPASEPIADAHVVSLRPGPPTRLVLDEALGRLGEAEREAFLMREVGGLGYIEIGAATGATPDAVRSRIHRARLALRKTLKSGIPSVTEEQEARG
jgi:RNA polymerase sigma-70 factor, ECF subfamily